MLRIIFFGTPKFSATVLDYLLRQNANIVAVVTKPNRPKGRSGKLLPPPVKEIAEVHGLPVYQPPKASDIEFAAILKNLKPDLFVVVAYSEIFKENLLAMPKLGCLNVHASILPKYRGAAPIQRAIMTGETETGVTIMSMAKELDAGNMLAIAKTEIREDMTAGELSEILSQIGAVALWEVIQKYEAGHIESIPQDAKEATYAKKISTEDAKINWQLPAKTTHDQIRGVTPNPGAWCWIEYKGEKKRLLIKKTSYNHSFAGNPGEMFFQSSQLWVACSQGAIQLLEVQLEGKKALSALEFLRGISQETLHFLI
jgi:methionyl-tRNA formyltransferase